MPATDEWQAALAAFSAWAQRQPRAPRDPASLVTDVVVTHEPVGLLATDLQGRRIVWKSVPADARARIALPPADVAAVDPWSVDAATLRARSDHIAVCDECHGQKTISCNACGGAGSLRCHDCNGQRKMYGYAANGSYRLLNCTTCRGKGELDCPDCRRGMATCAECGGQGRVQRWLELEWWQRPVATAHPEGVLRQFGWDTSTRNDEIALDAEPAVTIEREHRLSAADLGNVPAQWLEILTPPMQPGERVTRQRLRIARVPICTVAYRLGRNEDRVTFRGRRLLSPANDAPGLFAQRAATLGLLGRALLVVAALITIAMLARGTYYWSAPTFWGLLAAAGALGTFYLAAADWTGTRRHTHRWFTASLALLVAALGFTYAALPRAAHAQKLIAAGELDRAEGELNALSDADPGTWADLRLARIAQTKDIATAREALAQIPRGLPQQTAGAAAVDRLILTSADESVREHHWVAAADALALLSEDARSRPESVAVMRSALLPLAKERIEKGDWPGAANALLRARAIGVTPREIEAAADPIRTAASGHIQLARRETDAAARLRVRKTAEQILVAWERATGNWGTEPLIALRTAMASDVAAVEKKTRRLGAS